MTTAADVRVPQLRRAWRDTVPAALAAAADRRARVLAHADLAERLVAELGYRKADQWNGYVPPAAGPADADGSAVVNTSPRRRALVAICAEALARERTP